MIFVIEFLHQFNVSFNFADDLERKEIEKILQKIIVNLRMGGK